jgi:hypothetical protein
MGMNLSTYVAYGVSFGSSEETEDERLLGIVENFEESIYEAVRKPGDPEKVDETCYPDLYERTPGSFEVRRREPTAEEQEYLDKYRAYHDAVEKANLDLGVDLMRSGHSDYPGYVLVVSETIASGRWTDTVPFPEPDECAEDGAFAKVSRALELLGIEPPEGHPPPAGLHSGTTGNRPKKLDLRRSSKFSGG